MDIEILQAQWKLGFIKPEQVHISATELLIAGVESPSMVRLAGMIGGTYWDIQPAIDQVFAEAGLAPVDERTARWRLAYEVARQIVAAELTPLDGASRLWGLATDLGLPKPLRYFVYLAADYGEGPNDRATEEAWFDARILETAQELLDLKSSLGGSPPPNGDESE
jgi:hypothetical protein